jgi:hypothetical protein
MKYEFHPAALKEYAEAVQFFAQQNRPSQGFRQRPPGIGIA